jgi:hypothetical protein
LDIFRRIPYWFYGSNVGLNILVSRIDAILGRSRSFALRTFCLRSILTKHRQIVQYLAFFVDTRSRRFIFSRAGRIKAHFRRRQGLIYRRYRVLIPFASHVLGRHRRTTGFNAWLPLPSG